MSALGYLAGLGIRALAQGLGQTVEWRATAGGTWATLTGALLEISTSEPSHDDQQHQDVLLQVAILTVPEDGPVLERGTQVRIDGDDQTWTVHSTGSAVTQRRYTCTRRLRLRAGADRGQVKR